MKFLIVGLGSMGKRRIRNLKAMGIQSILGFDIREDRRKEAVERYQIDAYGSLKDALEMDPDALVISLPPDLHVQYAMEAIKAGKPFFTEASVVMDGIEELIKQMHRHNIIGFPSCTTRFFPGPRRIKELIKDGAIGRPLAWTYHCGQYLPDWHPYESVDDFYVSKRETGGCREIVPFELVWITDVFGSVHDITARVGKVSALSCDIDDIYQLLIKHSDNIAGSLTIDVIARPGVRHMRVLGSEGTLEWDDSKKIIRIYYASKGNWTEENVQQSEVEKVYFSAEAHYIWELKTFIECIQANKTPDYTFEDDLEILKLLQAAERSNTTGRRVTF